MQIPKISSSNNIISKNNVETNTKKEEVKNQKYDSSLNCLANYNMSNISFGAKLNTDTFDLSKIKLSPKFKTMDSHAGFMFLSRALSHQPRGVDGMWHVFVSQDETHCPWKMHLFADNEEDFQKMTTLIAPYLAKNDISWKAVGLCKDISSAFDDPNQKGKAITIYPHNNDEFARLAHDINLIIKNNNLSTEDSEIVGDRQLGDSGRIFYRYEYKSKQYQDLNLNLYKEEDQKKYKEIYDPACERDANYLAKDMTTEDDIWYNFNPDVDGAKVTE